MVDGKNKTIPILLVNSFLLNAKWKAMDIKWNPQHLDLSGLLTLSRGDQRRTIRYLQQFQELIPERIEVLKGYLEKEDRKMIRQTVHKMSPQLQFFGVPDIAGPIRRLELDYETMPMGDLRKLAEDILAKLDLASHEVEEVIRNHFSQ